MLVLVSTDLSKQNIDSQSEDTILVHFMNAVIDTDNIIVKIRIYQIQNFIV